MAYAPTGPKGNGDDAGEKEEGCGRAVTETHAILFFFAFNSVNTASRRRPPLRRSGRGPLQRDLGYRVR